ncbi:MAG TPA: ComF family protein [Beutenbergiaceae bacterium]|nr:ComF family protein [Beutenbergiaceae bacterium]
MGVADLVVPVWCPGCGQAGVSLCQNCALGLTIWFRAEDNAASLPPGLPVWACGSYAHENARIIMAWKSGHRPDLAPVLHRLGQHLGQGIYPQLDTRKIVVVPAPSGWRRSVRGEEVVAPFAHAVASGITKVGGQAQVISILRRRGRGQKRLSQRGRRTRRRGSLRAKRRSVAFVRDTQVLLVDDVLTTGATLGECVKVLSPFAPVIGAIVLAATPNPVIHR